MEEHVGGGRSGRLVHRTAQCSARHSRAQVLLLRLRLLGMESV